MVIFENTRKCSGHKRLAETYHVTYQDAAAFIQMACRDLCRLYTSDAADDLPCVDLGGRRLIKKQNNTSM